MNPKGRFPARELNRFTLPVGAVCGNGQPLRPFSTFLALYGLQNALARVCTKAGNRQSPAPRNNRSTPHRQLLQAKSWQDEGRLHQLETENCFLLCPQDSDSPLVRLQLTLCLS
jgi:hypothetical protein